VTIVAMRIPRLIMPVLSPAVAVCLAAAALTGCAAKPIADPPAGSSPARAPIRSLLPTQAGRSPQATRSTAPPTRRTTSTTLLTGSGILRTLRVAISGDPSATTRNVVEFIPPVATPAALPVVYLLHGLPGTATDLCNARSAQLLLKAFRAGSAPFVLACPDGNPTNANDSEWADSTDGKTKLETFVTSTVIRAVEGTQRRTGGMRAIAGFSMGGFGAASLALRHPGLYSQVATFAGYFHVDDPDDVLGTSASAKRAHDPTALVGQARSIRWYLDEAAADDQELTSHDSARFSKLLSANGATVSYRSSDGGHSPSWVISELPHASVVLSAGWRI
jgi:S-formylglutathione hydrolase FrmB